MKFTKYIIAGGAAMALAVTSCTGDLNVEPDDPNVKLELSSADEYLGLLARAYGGLVMEGGISVDDGGAGVYTRQLFNQQELTTDEAIVGTNINDAGIAEMSYAIPGADNHWIYEMYSRINYQIALCNEFIRKIGQGSEFFSQEEINSMKAEARVLRDLSYYHMIDIFGRGPWTDETSEVGVTPPTYDRQQLYDAVVADLIDAIPSVAPAAQQEYGRVSREAAYALLAKLYLNAGVYTGTPAYDKCAQACQEIVKTVNSLAPTYKYLFCASNKKYVASATYGTSQGEILWSIPQDNSTMQTYGGTTYLSCAAYNPDVADPDLWRTLGIASYKWNPDINANELSNNFDGWQMIRMRPELVRAFDKGDNRYLAYEGTFNADLNDISSWDADGDGYMCTKFVYTTEDNYDNTDGNASASTCFNSADFPVFRLADIYLMLAECQLNGVSCDGLSYYNKVRQRANASTVGSYTADDLLAERMRELYWEGHRRSDLIRFGKYTGSNYNWQWKGGTQAGTAIASYRDLMPVPSQFTPTLGQNQGY